MKEQVLADKRILCGKPGLKAPQKIQACEMKEETEIRGQDQAAIKEMLAGLG